MALAASTCVWRSRLIMKSASFRAVQPVWRKRIHDYVDLDNLSDISAYRNHDVQQCEMQIP